jgi:hypothetical protein
LGKCTSGGIGDARFVRCGGYCSFFGATDLGEMMAKKVLITEKQKEQFNQMLFTLKMISKSYMSPEKLRKDSEEEYGLDYTDTLEMAYENIQWDAKKVLVGIRPIK